MTHRIPLGPFELYRPVGKGGMGEVWEGMHVPQRHPVAVKVLTHRGARRDVFSEAFRTEVRAAAGLDHPAIVTVLDFGEVPAGAAKLSGGMFEAGSPYIVMEFAQRGTVKRFQNAIGWRELKVVLTTILDALAHAHARGVIHRDLKPANILVGCGAEDAAGIKLTDFGLAHALDQHDFARRNDSGWGTPQFMAPEQFRAAWRDYGPWTDLYALGIMAFHLAVGEYPYDADTSGSLARAHTLTPPKVFRPRFEVPEHFDRWIARLIQKNPEDRFQCAADAAWALHRLVDPPSAAISRDTVSMLPIRDTGKSRHQVSTQSARRQTADYRTPAGIDDNTILDVPDTTLLIPMDEKGNPRDTASFSLHTWETTSQNAAPREEVASPAFREVPPIPFTWRRPRTKAPSLKLLGAGLGLYGLRSLSMVDRDEERDFLWETLKTVREKGRARAVLIRGAAGTGKSRLARWLCGRAQEVGSATVMKALFSPIAGPGDGLARMLAQHLRAGGMSYDDTKHRVGRILERWGVRDDVEVKALTDFLLPVDRSSPHDALSIRMQSAPTRYGLLFRHLQRLCEERPVLVWFDDVQWGADALAFVQFVIERQHQTPSPVMFVMTSRDEALVSRAVETQLVAELARNRRMRVLDVEPLRHADTAELVRELLYLSPPLAMEVEKRCGGNPLFAVQLVGDWVAGNKLRFGREGFEFKSGAQAAIPDDLHSIWKDRLSLLLRKRPAEDQVALEIAAALGTSVELDEWYAACAQHGVSAANDLTRDLLESGLAESTDYGFDFCHGLFRESLERSAREAGRWRDVNGACLRMLEARYPQRQFPFSERFAGHLREADTAHLAVEPLLHAARARIDRSEYEVATALLDDRELLLQDFGLEPDSQEYAQGWTTRAEVALWQGHYEDAERYASQAAVQARKSGWHNILGKANLAEGLASLYRGDLDRAQRMLERAEETLRRCADHIGEGECTLALGRVAQNRGDSERATNLFEAARDIMVRARYRLGEAQCLNALGDVARDRAQYLDARRHAEEARAIFEQLNNAIGVADCTNDLAELSRLEGDFDEASEKCSRALGMYESLGSEHSMHVRTNLALTLAAQGQDHQARQLLDEVRDRFQETDQAGPLGATDILLLPILARLGELELLRTRFDEAEPLIERTGLKGRDVLIAALQAVGVLRDMGQTALAERVREFAEEHLT